MPSGPPLPGMKVPALTELKVECEGSFGHCGQPMVGPFWKVLYQIRPPLKSPDGQRCVVRRHGNAVREQPAVHDLAQHAIARIQVNGPRLVSEIGARTCPP